jgi:phosphoribosylformylglycinamidine synthase
VPLFRVPVEIVPRTGLLDPQGNAVANALRSVGFPDVKDVHVGRFIIVHADAADAASAERSVTAMCEKLLANPNTEQFHVKGAEQA